jgi:hypothetical protein
MVSIVEPAPGECITTFLDGLIVWVGELTPAIVGGRFDLLCDLCFSIRRFVQDARERFKWVFEVPYLFANVLTRAGAAEILQQWTSIGRELHHHVTCRLMDRFQDAIELVAAGDASPPPDELVAEQAIFRNMPLTSDLAEGYHRTASQTVHRAPVSKMPWVLSTQNLPQNLELVRDIMATEQGCNCVCAEWNMWNRILQTKPGHVCGALCNLFSRFTFGSPRTSQHSKLGIIPSFQC